MSSENIESVGIASDFLLLNTLVYYKGECFKYGGKCYEKIPRGELRQQIAFYIQDNYKAKFSNAQMVSAVIDAVRDRCYQAGEHLPFYMRNDRSLASVMVLNNGILDLEPMAQGKQPELRPHSEELFATTYSQFDYDPKATCKGFDEFLAWMASGDVGVQQLLLEFMAYCLLRWLNYHKCMILQGDGANGKSVFLNTLETFIAPGNCSAIPLERFGNQFGLAGILDKYVNLSADTNDVSKVAEGNLKMLVDESQMMYERKFQNAFSGVCRARLILASNIPIRWRDRTDGLWRRLLIVPCLAKVVGKPTPNLHLTFNYSGILNRVIEAGFRLIERGQFDIPEVVQNAINVERTGANPARCFFESHVVVAALESVTTEALYSQYKEWCVANGYMSLSSNKFGEELRRQFHPEIQDGRIVHTKVQGVRHRSWGYKGLAYCKDREEFLERLEYLASQRSRVEELKSRQGLANERK